MYEAPSESDQRPMTARVPPGPGVEIDVRLEIDLIQ